MSNVKLVYAVSKNKLFIIIRVIIKFVIDLYELAIGMCVHCRFVVFSIILMIMLKINVALVSIDNN